MTIGASFSLPTVMRGIACSCVVGCCENSHASGIQSRLRKARVRALVRSRVRRRRRQPGALPGCFPGATRRSELDAESLPMPATHFTDLLIVAAAGLLAPLALGFFPRVRIPAIVLEILFGIVIGPSVLGLVKPDLPVTVVAVIGLAFLLFLAGLEFDIERLRGRV